MASTKIGQRYAVLDGRLGQPERGDKDCLGIGTSHTVQTIKKYAEVRFVRVEERLDQGEIENRLK